MRQRRQSATCTSIELLRKQGAIKPSHMGAKKCTPSTAIKPRPLEPPAGTQTLTLL